MDIPSLMRGAGAPGQEQAPAITYAGEASSPLLNGEVELFIGESALSATTLFDTVEIRFAEINGLTLADYTVTLKTDGDHHVFSRLGNWLHPFYDILWDAYNKAVLRAFFITSNPILTASGEYAYTEGDKSASGSAPFQVFENCIVLLPPNLSARRIPLCFATGMEKSSYGCTLKLDTGENYTFSKLGRDTAPFVEALEKQLRKLREEALAAARELDSSLTAAQAAQLARLMPKGVATAYSNLHAIAPSFVAAVEGKIAESRAGISYKAFQQLCDPEKIYVGFSKNEIAEGEVAEPPSPDPYLFWLAAPSPDGQFAAVEFSEANSATFVYRTGGDFEGFIKQLNRALEAISFRREVIRLSDTDLQKPENADYYMAAKRTASLQFVRANFAGRVIHASPDSWRKKLLALWSADAPENY